MCVCVVKSFVIDDIKIIIKKIYNKCDECFGVIKEIL